MKVLMILRHPKYKFILILFLLCLFLWGPDALAKEELLEPIPRILDFDRRDALTPHFEITPYGGDFIGDISRHSFIVGTQVEYRLSPMWVIGADFGWTRVRVDTTGGNGFGSILVNRNQYLIDGKLVINMPAAFLSGRSVVEFDFFTNLGGGVFLVNNTVRPTGFVGGGIKIYFKGVHWIGAKADLRYYFSSIQEPNGSKFSNDVTMMMGPVFQFPPFF